MSQVSAAPGWYADPTDSGRWRWFDGAAWTEHVSAPAPAVLPASAASYAYADAGTGLPDRRSWWRRTSPVRLVVISVVTLVALFSLGLLNTLSKAGRIGAPAGPPLVLRSAAPSSLGGLAATSDPLVIRAADGLRTGLGSAIPPQPGRSAPAAAGYGTAGARAALVGWVGLSARLRQSDQAASFAQELRSLGAASVLTTTEPDGGTLVCGAAPGTSGEGPVTQCFWLRSGTGLVQVVEGDQPPATVADHTRAVVRELTGS